jgi:hypothetical protein
MKVAPTGWRADVYAESNSGITTIAANAFSMRVRFS